MKKVICINDISHNEYHYGIMVNNIYYSKRDKDIIDRYEIYDNNYNFIATFHINNLLKYFKTIEKVREERLNDLL